MIKHRKLPPDPEGQNDNRAQWAHVAVDAFIEETGTDFGDALSDLLCDLMHLCDRKSVFGKFEAQLDRARFNYEEETLGE